MEKLKTRKLSDEDWRQLLNILASGYLPLCDGDIREAMRRALTAHSELIQCLKKESIMATLSDGTVTMCVPDGGGVALRLAKSDLDVP